MYRGVTLIELLFVLAVAAILALLATPPYVAVRNRAAVQSSATAAIFAFDAMRSFALTRARHAALLVDTAGGRLVVYSRRDTVLRLPLRASFGVHLASTRDSTAIAPDGLGYGAANLRLIMSRGAAAETINVSRLGRVLRR